MLRIKVQFYLQRTMPGPRLHSLQAHILLLRQLQHPPHSSDDLEGPWGHRTAACNALLLRGHLREETHSAVEVVAGTLAVELARAEVDVRRAVAVLPALRLGAVGAGVAGVEGNRL